MRQFLVFTLAAPLASFGTLAVGERRPTWDRPSKSQTLGLIAAALGIERSEEERQRTLARSFGFAVRVDDAGKLLTDYHTTQQPSGASVRRRRRQGHPIDTRRDELLCDDIETGLSRRELRESATYSIALWALGDAIVPLTEIEAALLTPGFVLYAGRKANALHFPCGPTIVEATDVVGAFAAFDVADAELGRAQFRNKWSPAWLVAERSQRQARIYTEKEGIGDQAVSQFEERRDMPESRAKWRFLRRDEALLATSTPEAPKP
jgi:CRISPR system Cascade subunit CasD